MLYRLSASVTVSCYTKVEADTLEEAMEIAEEREVQIGGIHSGYEPDEYWIIDDGDGTPEGVHET